MSAAATGQERLACGRRIDDVFAQVADGRGDFRDAHQQRCPHCQAALAEYTRLWAPVTELATVQVSAPDGLVERALRRIRGVAEQPGHGVLESAQGQVRVAARVVVVVARETAEGVPGVRVALSRHLDDHRPGDRTDQDGDEAGHSEISAGVAGRSTAVQITLAADYGLDLHRLGEQVRVAVTAGIRALTGLDPVHVAVVIDDVFE